MSHYYLLLYYRLRRNTSALARFTRSVSKLSRHRRRGSDLSGVIIPEEKDTAQITTQNVVPIMRRSETVPAVVGPRSGREPMGGPSGPDRSAFLHAVPDMLAVDATIASAATALRSAESLAKSLRASAAEMDTSGVTPSGAGAGGVNGGWDGTASTAAVTSIASADKREWEIIADALEAAISEHRFEDAVHLLRDLHEAGEALASGSDRRRSSHDPAGAAETAWLIEQKIQEAELRVASALQRAISLPEPVYSPQLESVKPLVALLAQTVSAPVALDTLLEASSVKLQDCLDSRTRAFQGTSIAPGAGAEDATIDLAASLGQVLTAGVQGTAEAAASILGSAPGLYGAVCDWTLKEVAFGCEMLRKSVILPRAAPAGLTNTTRCVAAFLAFCDIIDAGIGVPAGQIARERVWPNVEAVLERKARQLGESLRKAAATEAVKVAAARGKGPSLPVSPNDATWDELSGLFPSAKRLLMEVGAMSAAVTPIAGPAAVIGMRKAITTIFLVSNR